jgi:2-polyprenyl-6-methoxyphenol hydroxylase-like FAD-dependent oxidoreductase
VSEPRSVLIVGAGIGGLCTALALERAGLEIDAVELNPAWDTYGVGIIQPGNALRALDDLGLATACIAQGFPMPGSVYKDRDGGFFAPPTDFPPLREGLPAMNGITRPRLHRILQDAVAAVGVRVRAGVTIAALQQREDAVDATFTDGGAGRYDLVIGADGINSLVRARVFGEEPRPEYVGQVCWRYNVGRRPDIERLTMFVGGLGKAGLVPLSDEQMYILLIEKPPDGEPLRVPPERLAEVFCERLAEYGGVVAEIRDHEITEPDQVVYRPVEAILVPPPWYRGRVLLIGDAAHATSPHIGQGAAQAIEDAVVLGEELGADQPLEAALEAFMRRRFERCKIVIEASLQMSRWEQHPEPDMDFEGTLRRATMAVAARL